MPFTLSHAAAALPLRRLLRGAVFPALVIGCFVPDVPYFLPDPLDDLNAHQLPGLIVFGMPCGWAIYALWCLVLRAPAVALLSPRAARLFAPTPARDGAVRKAVGVTASLFAGAASHVAWDAFTHRRGAIVQAWPLLAQPLIESGRLAVPTYVVLQHLSTAVGLVVLALHVRCRLRDLAREAPACDDSPRLPRWARRTVIALLAVSACALVGHAFAADGAAPWRFSAYALACRSVSSAAVVAMTYALIWHAVGLRAAAMRGLCGDSPRSARRTPRA